LGAEPAEARIVSRRAREVAVLGLAAAAKRWPRGF
jgi:hypothetical protein